MHARSPIKSGVTQPGCSTCERCEKSGRECRRGITIRFRAVTSVREKRPAQPDDDDDRTYHLSWKKSQVWVRVPPAGTCPRFWGSISSNAV